MTPGFGENLLDHRPNAPMISGNVAPERLGGSMIASLCKANAVAIGVIVVGACSSASFEDVQSSSEAITSVGPNSQVTTFGSSKGAAETSAAIVRTNIVGSPTPARTLVVAFNALGTAGITGWAVSANADLYTTWTQHAEFQNPTDVFYQGLAPTMSDGCPYLRSVGDPTVVATGHSGQAALVFVAVSTCYNPKNDPDRSGLDTVVAVWDNVNTGIGLPAFSHLTVISDPTSNGNLDSTASVDQPKIVMMEPDTHAGYIFWATSTKPQFSHRWIPFYRRIHFNPNSGAGGNIDLGPVMQANLPTGYSHSYNWTNIVPWCVSNTHLDNCQGSEVMVAAWPMVGPASQQNVSPFPTCPNSNTVDIIWNASIGDPIANFWPSIVPFAHDENSPVCVIFDPVNGVAGRVGNQRREPTIVRERTQNQIHVFLSMSKYWHGVVAPANNRGTRINHFFSPVVDPLSFSSEELDPVMALTSPAGAQIPCQVQHADDECFVEQFAPAVAVAHAGYEQFSPTNSKLGVSYHDTRLTNPSSDPSQTPPLPFLDAERGSASVLFGVFGSFVRHSQLAISGPPSVGAVPYTNFSFGGNTMWGDYEGMGVDEISNSFYPSWGDNRGALPITQVETTQWHP
ncbi:hypothetical protein BH09MYX1_BH09MYX1_27450 [soil metagenome]